MTCSFFTRPAVVRGAAWAGGLCLMLGLAGADWTRFRGPSGNGVDQASNVVAEWSDEQNIVWKQDLPGMGTSSPIVWKDRIFLTCYNGYGLSQDDPGDREQLKRHVLCLNRADGKIVWQQEVKQNLPDGEYQGFQALHGFASSTPATDGEQVFFFFGKSGVAAYSLDGQLNWQVDVGGKTHGWGSATSPVLFEDLVIVNASVESGSMVALRKKDGSTAWKTEGMKSSWNTPVLVQVDGRTELVASVHSKLLGFDPKTGEQLWNCGAIEDYVCPSVIAHDDVVYAIGGRKNTAVAVKAGGKGDVTATHQLWKAEKGSNVSSPVYVDGHLYWVNESRGVAYCLNAATGETVYEQRLEPRPDRVYASPLAVDGKVYYVSRNNGTFVVEAKPEFKLLAHNKFESDKTVFNASPVLSNGQILLRSDKAIYCIGAK